MKFWLGYLCSGFWPSLAIPSSCIHLLSCHWKQGRCSSSEEEEGEVTWRWATKSKEETTGPWRRTWASSQRPGPSRRRTVAFQVCPLNGTFPEKSDNVLPLPTARSLFPLLWLVISEFLRTWLGMHWGCCHGYSEHLPVCLWGVMWLLQLWETDPYPGPTVLSHSFIHTLGSSESLCPDLHGRICDCQRRHVSSVRTLLLAWPAASRSHTDTSSGYLSAVEQTDSEDVSRGPAVCGSQSGPPVAVMTGPYPNLSPMIIMNNVVLKQVGFSGHS